MCLVLEEQSYMASAEANIFSKLGMSKSFFNDEVNDVVKNRTCDPQIRKA
jgi:hypothetical protein